MANTSAIWQQTAHTTYQLSSPSCWTRAIQKSLTLYEKYLKVFWKKKSGEWTISRKMTRQKEQEDQAEKTREDIGKGNQMTALRFQTGGRYQTSPASLWEHPRGWSGKLPYLGEKPHYSNTERIVLLLTEGKIRVFVRIPQPWSTKNPPEVISLKTVLFLKTFSSVSLPW